MTKLGPADYTLVGQQGVALVIYTLRKMGIHAMEAGEGLPFDILTFHAGKPLRIQSKSTQTCDAQKRYSFITAKGRYAPDSRHMTSLTPYTVHEIDLLACAALPIDKVLFVPVTKVSKSKVVLTEAEFAAIGAARTSFDDGMKELQLVCLP